MPNSMVVYISDYYYGIAEQRKMDLAARRIGKVIELTIDHDDKRAEYLKNAKLVILAFSRCSNCLTI